MSRESIKIDIDDAALNDAITRLEAALATQGAGGVAQGPSDFIGPPVPTTTGKPRITRTPKTGRSGFADFWSAIDEEYNPKSVSPFSYLPSINRDVRLTLGGIPGFRAASQADFMLRRLGRGVQLYQGDIAGVGAGLTWQAGFAFAAFGISVAMFAANVLSTIQGNQRAYEDLLARYRPEDAGPDFDKVVESRYFWLREFLPTI